MKKITLALSALALALITPISYYTARQYLIANEVEQISEYATFEVSDEDALPLAQSSVDESERLDGRRGVGGEYDSIHTISTELEAQTPRDMMDWTDL